MTAELLSELHSLGVEISPQGSDLVICPASKVPPELKARLRKHKPEILAVLRARSATCSPTCYQVERGGWVHDPWDGCNTPVSRQAADHFPQAECKHCDGSGECSCSACTLRWTEKAVPCLMCQPQKRQAWLAATRPEERESATVPS